MYSDEDMMSRPVAMGEWGFLKFANLFQLQQLTKYRDILEQANVIGVAMQDRNGQDSLPSTITCGDNDGIQALLGGQNLNGAWCLDGLAQEDAELLSMQFLVGNSAPSRSAEICFILIARAPLSQDEIDAKVARAEELNLDERLATEDLETRFVVTF